MTAKPKCGHRSYGGRARDGGFVLQCKACGLVTTTVHPDLTTAALHKLEDFRDAEAEIAAGKQRKKEIAR